MNIKAIKKIADDIVIKDVDPRISLLFTTEEEVKAYLVDADKVAFLDTRWKLEEHKVLGNHHWGRFGKYIPSDEVWISDENPTEEINRVAYHEIFERHLCLSQKFDVDYAHNIVKISEKCLMDVEDGMKQERKDV
jgi:hypothetical protein